MNPLKMHFLPSELHSILSIQVLISHKIVVCESYYFVIRYSQNRPHLCLKFWQYTATWCWWNALKILSFWAENYFIFYTFIVSLHNINFTESSTISSVFLFGLTLKTIERILKIFPILFSNYWKNFGLWMMIYKHDVIFIYDLYIYDMM